MTTADAQDRFGKTNSDANADLEVDHAALDEPRGKWQAADEAAAHTEYQLERKTNSCGRSDFEQRTPGTAAASSTAATIFNTEPMT